MATIILSGRNFCQEKTIQAMRQANDAQLGCQEIAIEYKSNTEVATEKIRRNQSADTHDIIVGFFVWPGLADFNNADGHEGNALLDRNVYLREIAKTKHCEGMEFWPRSAGAIYNGHSIEE